MPRGSYRKNAELIEVNGLKVYQFEKVCAYCHKTYKTTSRQQKYCSDACCKKAQVKHIKQQREYRETQETQRLSSRAHAVGVAVLKQLETIGEIEHKCVQCGATENLQCHHKNLDFFNNSPSNIEWRCSKCHADIHSKIESDLKAKGQSVELMYEPSTLSILRIINKNLQ